jgi:hypothetical protein
MVVLDPQLASHLACWGINMMQVRRGGCEARGW